ncbi:hypothetical protein Ancab_018527 [Ancistrocladus abbreviatus]
MEQATFILLPQPPYSCPPSLVNIVGLLSLLIFFLLPHYSLSLAKPDQYYEDCAPQMCGNVNVSYPFYIEGQQKEYCGFLGFQLHCQNNTPLLNLSGNIYAIEHISYGSQSVQIINSAFLGSDFNCINVTSIHNFTLDGSQFNFPDKSLLYLLSNCPGLKGNQIPFPCRGGKGNYTIVAAGHEGDLKDVGVKCETAITVPFDQSYAAAKPHDVIGLLKRGISVVWRADNCTRCTNSGGRCGYNSYDSEFRCFCTDRPHTVACHHRKRKLPYILGIGIPGGIIIFIALVLLWHRDKLRSGSRTSLSRTISLGPTNDLEGPNVYFGVPVFSYHELKESTDNFDPTRELGSGGFGTVYHGRLKDGREVAVKRLYEKNYKRIEQFMNEVQILTCLHHQNLVTLYGCTSRHSHGLLLVYEYIPNGTVADHLHGDKSNSGSLTWPIRLSIAIETASALSYLHASDIIHRDVKTNNILLDNNFCVKVADFGLSRLFPTDVTHISTAPQGTPGYLDPEYHQCYQLTDKSDVYSFGVVLIELISSLPAVDIGRDKHEINLAYYAMTRIQRSAFNELVDPNLGFDSDYKVKGMTTLVAELAFQCLQHEKEFRPSMDEVVESLKRIESADYEAWKAGEMEKNDGASQSSHTQLSPIESDDVGLLKNAQHPSSPITVMVDWASRSTTSTSSS